MTSPFTLEKLQRIEKAGRIVTSGNPPAIPFDDPVFSELPDELMEAWKAHIESKERLLKALWPNKE